MASSFSLNGVYSAQWIPVDTKGRLERGQLAEHMAFQRQHGISGILALGSTGEFPFFDLAQRKEILACLVELAAPMPVLANISDIRPGATIELGRYARELGVKAVALMPPMFYPVSPDDMLAYFLEVADAVGLPTILYNFPELTGKRIDLATVRAFADRCPMIGFKQSGGEFSYHRELVALGREKGFVVMSGADTRLSEAFALGASGCIGGLVNIVPDLMVALHRAHSGLEDVDVATVGRRMVEVGTIVERLTFPLNVAAGLEARGFHPGAPKSVVSASSQSIYREVISELGSLFSSWGLELASAEAPTAPSMK
jgi:4-hydroxy-tetrahydrodipicolinate synthase